MKLTLPSILRTYIFKSIIAVLVFFAICPLQIHAQCSSTINSFPYNEGFESSNGGWTSGGTNSDWAWGIPIKSTINKAATGSKCWITGGLNKVAYNSGQNSWLKTPCFNLSNIQHPYIKFYVFWDTEGQYDGANIEYSINNGTSWQLLGSLSDTKNCLNENWYNASSIKFLNDANAWSGTNQSGSGGCVVGNGSGKWVLAQHTLPLLAGKTSVSFRFVFASGSSCNSFDGFAIDDFTIGEAPSNDASFTYSCVNNNTINFTSTSTPCPVSYLWNFGDPSSGSSNTSTLPNPSHTYALAGDYFVSLTVTGPDNGSSTYIETNFEIINSITAKILQPVLCNADKTGAAYVSFSGGGSQFIYSWNTSPVQNTDTARNLGAGNYIVTVSGLSGCAANANITLTEPLPVSYTVVNSNASCGSNNGSITLDVSGGVFPYTYQWSPNVSTSNIADHLFAGDYTILVTDNNNCQKTINTTVANNPGTLAITVTNLSNITCAGGNNGSATVNVTGGTTPYIYDWLPFGGAGNTASSLVAGNYKVIATDQTGCKDSTQFTLTEPLPLQTNLNIQNTPCGTNQGSASVSVSGGTGNYQYLWTPGNFTTPTINNLVAGKYIVLVTDANGCTKIDSAIVSGTSGVSIQLSKTDLSCFENNTGAAQAVITGGVQPYTIQWSNGVSTFSGNNITNLPAGKYIIQVQDASICSAIDSISIIQPAAINIGITTTPETCNKGNGSAIATVGGGTAPYSYSWSPSGGKNATELNLSAGNYTLTVLDGNGCVSNSNAIVTASATITSTITGTATSCGNNNGTIQLDVQGGLAPYQYQWTPGNVNSNTLTALAAGKYIVLITDQNGCTKNDSIDIAPSQGITVQLSATDALCAATKTGTANAVISGGNLPYLVNWDNNLGENFSGNTITNLSAGIYTIHINDADNCTVQQSITINEPLPIGINLISTAENCDAQDGSIISNITGGTQPYQYQWLPINSNSPNLNNLAAGTYQLTVNDANNCMANASETISKTNTLSITLGNDTTICSGDIIHLYPGSFISYLWQDNSISPSFSAITEGLYTVNVTDQNGCTANASINIVADCGDIYFPSGFTPNHDGLNDNFGPIGNINAISNYEMNVYNRFGKLVFQSKTPGTKWDGTVFGKEPQSAATYVWFAKFVFKGTNYTRKGTITILR
ncbi:T9SS type B sorting domain-containing protein [Limnovirga soli]|uniref:T9SS type B sorting domain-containing protein n=1 Tax=Limnovirga soli TaxID=2656915 RepID=A0A8J8FB71_9BACT|nr:gliding motility-associated C-terminal domain-containing protein [Limnovirga soli]NNV54357.1 T9SS type B sorting domain-containing protein [Limnovirga soli]